MGCRLFRTEELTRIQLAVLRWKKERVWLWKVMCLQKGWRKIRCFSEIDFEISHSSLQNNCLPLCHLSSVRQKSYACHLIWAKNSLESLGFVVSHNEMSKAHLLHFVSPGQLLWTLQRKCLAWSWSCCNANLIPDESTLQCLRPIRWHETGLGHLRTNISFIIGQTLCSIWLYLYCPPAHYYKANSNIPLYL